MVATVPPGRLRQRKTIRLSFVSTVPGRSPVGRATVVAMTPRTTPFAQLLTLLFALLTPLAGNSQEAAAQPLPCNVSSNCVNSASDGFAPLAYAGDAARGLALLQATLGQFPEATVTASTALQLTVIFRTTLGFKDEVVFVLEPAGQRIHFRSRSLLGLYDFGKNRTRMTAVVARFQVEAAR